MNALKMNTKPWVLGVYFYSFCCQADVGSNWPTEEEMEKAPDAPAAVSQERTHCEAMDPDEFLETMRSKKPLQHTDFRIRSSVDLNEDGICEVIAYEPNLCGKWCYHMAFQRDGDGFKQIGIGPSGFLTEFLEPHNGYLQFRDASYTGTTYYFHYYRFQNGKYSRWRADRFEEKWFPESKMGKTFYVSTEYFEQK